MSGDRGRDTRDGRNHGGTEPAGAGARGTRHGAQVSDARLSAEQTSPAQVSVEQPSIAKPSATRQTSVPPRSGAPFSAGQPSSLPAAARAPSPAPRPATTASSPSPTAAAASPLHSGPAAPADPAGRAEPATGADPAAPGNPATPAAPTPRAHPAQPPAPATPPPPARPCHQPTWTGDPPPAAPLPGPLGWALVALRGTAVISVLLIGVLLILPLRGAERLAAGRRRPLTGPWVQGVCRLCLWVMGIGWRRQGTPMRGPGAMVANHSSWLDIFVLNAAAPVFFVSKAEVAGWPGINILTRVTDTHFVARDPRLARAQAAEFAQRTALGHRLLFFPEGTSTDGQRVLPFKPTLFQGFLDPALPPGLAVQPVSVAYTAPTGRDPRFYGWWGDMALGPHLLAVLAQPRQGRVTVTLHDPIPVANLDRKALSARAEAAVRSAAPEDAPRTPSGWT